ncbi:MAG: DUF3618 domain-containing protein [Actinomycetales bacterium]|nr:DUF3618 domain-containing protein [Actinomycetales bacterium]
MAENPSDQIARELAEVRARLNNSVEDLQDYLKPANVASRGAAKISRFFVAEDGQPQVQRIAAVGASALAFFGIALKSHSKKDSE